MSSPLSAVLATGRRSGWHLPRLAMLPTDIGLFLKSARTDKRLAQLRSTGDARAAFEAIYSASPDPWASASPRYRYQSLKYDKLIGLLPKHRFGRALDLGCGLGLMTQRLAPLADEVLGLDIAEAAVTQARQRASQKNLRFAQADLLDLPRTLDGRFDLVVVADILYYLSPLDERVLKSMVARIAGLLAPGGICLLANHFFFAADPDSRISRRIHHAFAWSPFFALRSEHRRAFFLASLLQAHPFSLSLAQAA
jgi:SAM-dependent methyltransferase